MGFNHNQNQSGFTLLEVMVAMIVFTLLAVTITQVSSTNINNHLHIEQKLIASWIAENKQIELRSVGWDKIVNGKDEVEMANQEWVVTRKVKPVKTFPGLPKIVVLDAKEVEISVALATAPNSPLINYTSYMANEDAI